MSGDEFRVSSSIPWSGPGPFPPKRDKHSGPPPPTYYQQNLTVELAEVTKNAVSVRLLNPKTLKVSYDELTSALTSSFMGQKLVPAYDEIAVGEHYLGLCSSA